MFKLHLTTPISWAMLGYLKSACEENLVPYPCICPYILNTFIRIRVVLGWKNQSVVDYKPVGCDFKFFLCSRVFLLKFGLADRWPVSHWPCPKHHITNVICILFVVTKQIAWKFCSHKNQILCFLCYLHKLMLVSISYVSQCCATFLLVARRA